MLLMNAEALLNKKEPSLENVDPAMVPTSLKEVQAGKGLQIRWVFPSWSCALPCSCSLTRIQQHTKVSHREVEKIT